MAERPLTHVYLAHPYGGDKTNLELAEHAYAILSHAYTEKLFVVDWILHCRAFDDSNPDDRVLGMFRNLSQIERCDELWAVGFGDVVISNGMEKEIRYARARGKPVKEVTLNPDMGVVYADFKTLFEPDKSMN